MHLDLSLWPTTLDVGHALLAGIIVILLILQILLLTVSVMAMLRRSSRREAVCEPPGEPIAPIVPSAAAVAMPEQRAPATKTAAPSTVREAAPDSALQLLSLLQNEARFVDFVQENVASFTDAEIGAAARIVHEGCRKVIRQHFELEPVRKEAENSRVNLPRGFDAASVRLTGNIVGQPPFNGTLVHRGWRVAQVKLPKIAEGHDTRIVAPAEVEL